MKTLKFVPHLADLILHGKKDTTWRINDEKSLDVGDELSLLRKTDLKEFAKVTILWIKETTFENLTSEDKEGHEKFSSLEEMYQTYTRYYNVQCNSKTKLKVVKFKVIEKLELIHMELLVICCIIKEPYNRKNLQLLEL